MNSFSLVIKNIENKKYDKKYDIVGPIMNDDYYNAVICNAINNGYNVNCESVPYTDMKSYAVICDDYERMGYMRDKDLFSKIQLMSLNSIYNRNKTTYRDNEHTNKIEGDINI